MNEEHSSMQKGLALFWREEPTPAQYPWYVHALHHGAHAWNSVRAAPLTSLLSLLIMTTVLCLFALFLSALENVHEVLWKTQSQLTVTLFLREHVPLAAREELEEEIKNFDGVQELLFHSKDEALKEFRARLGKDAIILEGLDAENPLPESLEVRFSPESASQEKFQRFEERFEKDPLVELVEFNEGLLAQLGETFRYLRTLTAAVVVFVLFLSGFVITLTIRLALYSHRQEIEIMQLVGATATYIRTPYIIEGCIQGILGGVLSVLLAYGLFRGGQQIVLNDKLLGLFLPSLSFLSWGSILLVIVTGLVVGGAGSYLAVKRFLVNYLT